MNIKPGDYFVVSPSSEHPAEYRRKFAGVVFEAMNRVGPLIAAKTVCGPLDFRPLLQHVDTSQFETYPVSRIYVEELLQKQGAGPCQKPLPKKPSPSPSN